MRSCIQRVTQGSVHVDGEEVGRIEQGVVVLLGVEKGDTLKEVQWMASKVAELRIFEDDEGKMNRSLLDTGGQVLAISQFTLLGDCRKGRRPSFIAAADPESANELYEAFVSCLREQGVHVETGRFQADMQVSLVNDGPVTMLLDSNKRF